MSQSRTWIIGQVLLSGLGILIKTFYWNEVSRAMHTYKIILHRDAISKGHLRIALLTTSYKVLAPSNKNMT